MNPKMIREYIRKQSFPKTEKHEEVKVLLSELAEFERLAEIGRATEKAFKQCDTRIDFLTSRKDLTSCLKVIRDTKELLDWAKED